MKIGYTTGVFDMFHVGHLNILRKAKAECDILIVGVSTDELVMSYKHKVPIIPFEQRKEIVAAIKYVDKVVTQSSRDKIKAYDDLHFDIMFVGNDWKGTPFFDKIEEELRKRNVEISYFPYTEGVSSTILREKLNSIYGR